MQLIGATKTELDLREILIWNEKFCALPNSEEASLRAGVLSCAIEELQRLRKLVEELEELRRWRKWPDEKPKVKEETRFEVILLDKRYKYLYEEHVWFNGDYWDWEDEPKYWRPIGELPAYYK